MKDLEITQVVFENGVRVNLKKTDFEKNSVRLMVSFGGGKLTAPADKPGLIPYAQSVFRGRRPGETQRGRPAPHLCQQDRGGGFRGGRRRLSCWAGRTTPGDLRDELGLVCAYLVAPGYREEADRQFRKNLDAIYTQLEHTAEGVMQNEVVGFIHGGDFRFPFPEA